MSLKRERIYKCFDRRNFFLLSGARVARRLMALKIFFNYPRLPQKRRIVYHVPLTRDLIHTTVLGGDIITLIFNMKK